MVTKEGEKPENWKLLNMITFKKVYSNNWMCACKPNLKCPCPEFIEKSKCQCGVFYEFDEIIETKSLQKMFRKIMKAIL